MSPFCVERSTEMVLMVQIVQFFVLALSQTDDNATKPANTHLQRLQARSVYTASIGKSGLYLCFGDNLCQS